MERLQLTPKQTAVVKELEAVLKKVWDAEIGLVLSTNSRVYAYNSADVSCFDAPSDAAYDDDAMVSVANLYSLNAVCRGDYLQPDEEVKVGLEAA